MKNWLFTLILAAPFAFGEPEVKGSPSELKQFLQPEETIISIQGSAEESAYSDMAEVNLIVTSESEKLAAAMQSNATLREQIRQQLSKQGISDKSINTSQFSASPQYGWFGKKPSSYKVVNRLAIKIAQESQLQAIAKIADGSEDVILGSVTPEHSQKETYKNKVREKALSEIMAKKRYYEATLGIKLSPLKFHEHDAGIQATEGAGQIEEVIVTGIRADKSGFSSRSHEYNSQRQASFDEVKYHSRVTVDFKVSSN